MFLTVVASAQDKYSGGSGTSVDPYQIASLEDLSDLCQTSGDWDKHFIQTADIDATQTQYWDDSDDNNNGDKYDDPNDFTSTGNNEGFFPIGGSIIFEGVYDGDGYTLSNLTINRPVTANVGLFGHIGGEEGSGDGVEIKNLGLTNVDVKGAQGTGSLVGRVTGDENTVIMYCYADTGSVVGDGATGGLVGSNNSYRTEPSNVHHPIIRCCYADIDVSWSQSGDGDKIAGLVGCNQKGKIYYSYALGSVTVDNSIGQTDPTPMKVGGLAACILRKGYVISSFSAGSVSTTGTVNDVGGFVGSGGTGGANGWTQNCFWDIETSGQSLSSPTSGCTGKTTAEMQRATTFLDAGWDFTLLGNIWSMNQDVNNNYSFLRMGGGNPAHVWLGSAKSIEWGNAGNWSENNTPGSTNHVIIPHGANEPTISNDPSSPATCNKLTIETGAALTISSGKALTVDGDLVVDGNFLIESDGTNGTGSLILNGSTTDEIDVERYLSADKWHYISGQTNISGIFNTLSMGLGTPGSTSNQFYRWEEDYEYEGNIGNWVDILNGEDGTGSNTLMGNEGFVDCKGYGIAYVASDKTLSLSGVPFIADQNITLTKTANSTGEGSNLVGNPFCSTIAINTNADADNNFLDQNADALEDSYEAIYVWNESEGWNGTSDADYDVYNNSSSAFFASPGQAFMVRAASHNATLDFNTSARKHGSSIFYKNSDNVDQARLTLYVIDPQNQSNKTQMYFSDGMTKGLDPSYDAAKLKGNPDLALYTKLIEDNGKDFAIQALPYFEEDYSIPVGIDISEEGSYTFEVVSMEQIPEDVHVYFEDHQTGMVTNLKETSAYTCVLGETGSITGRFVLHFTLTAFGEEELQANESPVQIWAKNKMINLYNPDQLEGTIKIFNLYGQQIMQTKLNGNQQQQINLQVPAAYYLVNVISEKAMISEKVFVY